MHKTAQKELKKEQKGSSTGNINRKKVEPPVVFDMRKERNSSKEGKKEESKKNIKSPVIEPKTEPRRSSKDLVRRSSSQDKRRSVEKKKPLQPTTPEIIGKV